MFSTRQGKEKASLAVMAKKDFYALLGHRSCPLKSRTTVQIGLSKTRTLTIGVESKGGIYVITEKDANHRGLRWKQVDSRHTIRTGRVHESIVCRIDIESKPV